MAAKYLLGPNAARWLHDAMNESGVGGRAVGKVSVFDMKYADPWTLRYSASLSNGEGEDPGGWIIWLPEGTIEGCDVDTDLMRPLNPTDDGMPEGWYVLPDTVSSVLDEDGEHSVYAAAGLTKIVFDTLGDGNIHVADVVNDTEAGTKNVKQIARSSMSKVFPKTFEFSNVGGVITITNPYYMVGARLYEGSAQITAEQAAGPCVIGLKIKLSGSSPVAELVSAASVTALKSLQDDTDYAIIPLYKIGVSGAVECDFRSMPNVISGEF